MHSVMFTSPPFRKLQVQRLVQLMRDPSPSVVKKTQHTSLAHPCASLAQEDSNMTRESPPLAIRTQPQPPNPVLHPVQDTPSQKVHKQVGNINALSAIRRYQLSTDSSVPKTYIILNRCENNMYVCFCTAPTNSPQRRRRSQRLATSSDQAYPSSPHMRDSSTHPPPPPPPPPPDDSQKTGERHKLA